jgi:hypothetical protein
MSEPKPWAPERRSRVKAKLDKEAARAAARLGAHSVWIIATFADGEFMHLQDGGSSPWPLKELYQQMLRATEMNEIADDDPGFVQ